MFNPQLSSKVIESSDDEDVLTLHMFDMLQGINHPPKQTTNTNPFKRIFISSWGERKDRKFKY